MVHLRANNTAQLAELKLSPSPFSAVPPNPNAWCAGTCQRCIVWSILTRTTRECQYPSSTSHHMKQWCSPCQSAAHMNGEMCSVVSLEPCLMMKHQCLVLLSGLVRCPTAGEYKSKPGEGCSRLTTQLFSRQATPQKWDAAQRGEITS